MRRLFSSFERAGLEYLLISGQASVLYGAAMFSEDVDLWIRPTPANARKLLLALADRRARVHRLTPALTLRNMKGRPRLSLRHSWAARWIRISTSWLDLRG